MLVHRRFAYWVGRQPDAPAVIDGGTTLTYSELDALTTSLAARLVDDGIGVEDAVAVQLPRGYRVVASFLAVLKAGGCYVPIDPEYPLARQQLMKQDSGSVRTLTSQDVDAAAASPRDTVDRDLTGANLAYIVYTSGSTGRPKGVMVEHRNVCNFMDEPRLGVAPGERVAQTVSIAFDVATFEVWGALCHGGCLVIMPSGRSIGELAAEVRRVRPDWMFLTAGVFHLMVEHDPTALAAVGTLQAGGDVLGPAQFCRASTEPRRGLFNAYGPSETTVYSGLYQAAPGQQLASVPIGSPPRNEHLVIAEPDPADRTGEILIGGDGVSRGYHQRPRLTAERFIPDPDARRPGGRRYRSGDLGSIAPDGSFLVHGRVDRQVKIRGHRVELAEIESVLAGHPEVEQAAVKTFDVGAAEKRLAAFVSLAPAQTASSAGLLAWLRERLPGYMIPAYLRVADEIPLDPNGKIDRAALPPPWTCRADMSDLDEYLAPSTPLEKQLATVWAETLQIDEVGVDDNYFLLGGDSLRSITLLAKLAEHGIEVTAEEFLGHQTVAELAELVRERDPDRLHPQAALPGTV
jgi:amino acid adenylation domain-containing protein